MLRNCHIAKSIRAAVLCFLIIESFSASPAHANEANHDISSTNAARRIEPAFLKVATPTFVRFAVIGDYGVSNQAEADVAALVKSWNPDFVTTVGDNNYPSGSSTTIDKNIGQYYHQFIYPYKGTYGAGAATNQFFPALGNHDLTSNNGAPYLSYFTLPGNERYYDFVNGPVHFFMLNSDSREPDGNRSTSIQAMWLKDRLAASTSPWNIVFLHHPPYSSGTAHASSGRLQWPYAAWGADAVLAGHEHNYERIHRDGILYFVNGAGGAKLYPLGTPIPGSQAGYDDDHGAMLVEASESQVNFQFINRSGQIIDTYNTNTRIDADTTGVFRPGNGALYLKNSNTTGFADIQINYGIAGDSPVVGDWDGNGTDTIGVYRNGVFYLRNSNTIGIADVYFSYGSPGDQPVAGDWNGDGLDTIGVYRSSTFTFYLRDSSSSGPPDHILQLGMPGDIGLAGDWTNKGFDTVGVFRPSNGALYLKNTNATGTADIQINYGLPGDKPITGDWNNDGIDTIGVYRKGIFYLRNSNTAGGADLVFGLGISGDMPIAGNWDGLP